MRRGDSRKELFPDGNSTLRVLNWGKANEYQRITVTEGDLPVVPPQYTPMTVTPLRSTRLSGS